MSSRLKSGLIALVCLVSIVGTSSSLRAQTADEILSQARKTYTEVGPAAALPQYERALALYREKSDRRGEAITLGYIGNCYKHLGDYPRALDELRRALALKQELGDRLEEGKTLSNMGLVFWEMGDYPKAIDHLTRSLEIGRALANKQLEAAALNNLGLVYDEQGDYKASLEKYQQALELHRSTHNASGESDALGNIGGVHLLLGRYREAMPYYEQSLAISERGKLKASASQDLGNLALCQLGLGLPTQAIGSFDRALQLAREAGLKKEEADWHKGKGSALLLLGKYDLARQEYRQALQIYEQAGLKREWVECLNDEGALYASLGDSETAEGDFRRAVKLARAIGHPRGVSVNLIALGDLERRRQRYEEAGALYREAFERAQSAKDQGMMATSLVLLALVLRDQGRLDEGHSQAQQALDIARTTGATLLEAQALYALGELARKAGKAEEALRHFGAGKEIAGAAGDSELTWQLAYGEGQSLEALERNEQAVASYGQAVQVVEGVRSQLQEERFRSGYLEDKFQVYVALVRLLLKLGKIPEAFLYMEKLRARSYLDLLDRTLPPVASDAEAELISRIRQLQRALDGENTKPIGQQKRGRVETLSSELVAAERKYQALLDDLRSTQPEYAALRTGSAPSAPTVQAALPASTALVEYLVGDDNLAIFVLTKTRVFAKNVAVRAADLRSKIELFRDLVARERTNDWVRPAESLERLLIAPIEQAGWLQGIAQLYVVPHGALHYLPFAALPRGGQAATRFLIQDYTLAYLPAASLLVSGHQAEDPKQNLMALAPERARLRFAQQEAQSLSSFFPHRNLILVGKAATENSFKQQAGRYEILHLATHGFFDKINPLFSGVELEPDRHDDGRLEVHEIMRLRLRANLVTLSACETALGSGYFAEYPPGDEFIGLTRAFLYAGSQGVLASLWEVNDRSTLRFMSSFYQNFKQVGTAAALAKAQRGMLQRGGRYRHPYFWAPFVLVGTTK